jgi:hypothetical protein
MQLRQTFRKEMDGMKEKVLIFGLEDKDTMTKMQRVLLLQKVGLRKIDPTDYEQTVGSLAGITGMEVSDRSYEGAPFPAPMMIFCMGQQKMYRLLDGFRKAGVPSVDYKAILTPTNSQWTPLQLYGELEKEHQAMHGIGK